MKNFYILLLLVGTSLSQNGGVSLEIQNVDTGAGTLDIYMTNAAACSYCADPIYNYNSQNWWDYKWNCENIAGSTWVSYDPITEQECSAIPSFDGNGGWWFDGEVGGFQFQLFGTTIDGAGGGSAEDNVFIINAQAETYNEDTDTQLPNILAFSITGTTIPSGSGILIQVSFSNFDGEICFGDDTGSTGANVISGLQEVNGSFLSLYVAANWGDCSSPQDDVYGCTYDTAINYNPVATFDDGSCEFLWGDVDHDGVLTIQDLILIVNEILSF